MAGDGVQEQLQIEEVKEQVLVAEPLASIIMAVREMTVNYNCHQWSFTSNPKLTPTQVMIGSN